MSALREYPPGFLEMARAVVDYDADAGVFYRLVGPLRAQRAGFMKAGYVRLRICGHFIYAHRLAWAFVHGELPGGFIDHVNGDRSDNRPGNLRLATHHDNARNRPSPKGARHGLKGVQLEAGGYWRARIKIGGKNLPLGKFATAQDAHDAYCRAASELFGEFAHA